MDYVFTRGGGCFIYTEIKFKIEGKMSIIVDNFMEITTAET